MEGVFLESSGLVKRYRELTVVNGVNLKVSCGEIVGLLGPNGAGKTTTFYMLAGFIRPDSGKVFFAGKDVTNSPVYKRARAGLGYLPQEPSVFRRLTVKENILASLETVGMKKSEQKEKLEELLATFGLNSIANHKAYMLSGGERRRVEIARAFARNPKILMLDEPFSGVDPLAVDELQRIIIGLKRNGIGIILTDHNVRETLSIVDRAYLIYEGRVLREGSSDFLINDPVSRKIYLGEDFKM